MEISIAKAHQEKTGAKSLWDNRRFAELMAYSHKDAAQYCIDCGNDTEINGISVYEIAGVQKEDVSIDINSNDIPEVNRTSTKSDKELIDTPIVTKEELRLLLKNNNIKFTNSQNEEQLFKLAKDNNLI